ncbi:FRG domain-containing protein [Flavobacterium sp. GCM10027622]|uniref:FRG domain-containing protein n=1 Tax=unclassified Flavobacterium TaxID=196869 RepID=UPI00360F2B73
MKLRVATSIDEYLKIVIDIQNENNHELWFRGQSNAAYYLLPSLFREKKIIGLDHSGAIHNYNYRKSDAIMKSDFAALDKFIVAYDNLMRPSQQLNKIDYLYLMQHYDIPTRLLDFTRNKLIALYFSLSKETKSNVNIDDEISDFMDESSNFTNDYTPKGYSHFGSSIYIISPHYTNLKSNDQEIVFDLALNDFGTLKKIDLPICIQTHFNDPRLIAQEGVFVFFGKLYNSYEYYNVLEENTYKIFIPNTVRKQMFEELKSKFKITHSKVFPDMKGIALEINDEINEKYKKDCAKIFTS